MSKQIADLPINVRERLEYFEFLIRFRGCASRHDLIERFEVGEAAATRDIRIYRQNAAENLSFNSSIKKYEINSACFKPLFPLQVQTAIARLRSNNIGGALGLNVADGVLSPPRLALPSIEILEIVVRAICTGCQIVASYYSVKNGLSKKRLYPHAIFDNGAHWYLRAYELDNEDFGEFKINMLTRFDKVELAPGQVRKDIGLMDHQWNRMVSLELAPHPNRKNVEHPETIEHNYKMTDGVLKVVVRAAVAGYWLKHWNVDCTRNGTLKGFAYQLHLRNYDTLYDVESRKIAPGLDDDYVK